MWLFPLGACYINIQDTEIATNLKLCVRNLPVAQTRNCRRIYPIFPALERP